MGTEGSLGGWTVVAGDGNNYVATDAFNGFSGGGPYEQWLVTPPIDVDRLEHKQLEFESAAMTPAGGCSIEVFAMTKQDPKAEDNVITLLPAQFAKAPKAGYSAWVPSGAIGLETFSGTIYIGWRSHDVRDRGKPLSHRQNMTGNYTDAYSALS